MNQHQKQEQSDIEAETIQDRFRRAGHPRTAGSLAFEWIALTEAAAEDLGANPRLILMAQLTELIEYGAGVKNSIEDQINRMNHARKNRSV